MDDAANVSEVLELLESDVRFAMKGMKTGKVAGSDGVTTEILQATGDKAVKRISEITNKGYHSG